MHVRLDALALLHGAQETPHRTHGVGPIIFQQIFEARMTDDAQAYSIAVGLIQSDGGNGNIAQSGGGRAA